MAQPKDLELKILQETNRQLQDEIRSLKTLLQPQETDLCILLQSCLKSRSVCILVEVFVCLAFIEPSKLSF